MIKFTLFFIAALVYGIEAFSIKERLIGATDAEFGEFPFIVSLRLNRMHFCSGTLITKSHILTAAHCVTAIDRVMGSFTAVVGTNSSSTGGKTYRISYSYQHPDFVFGESFANWKYDIGIFKVDPEVELSDLVSIAKLPTKDVEIGSRAVVSGWGTTKDIIGWPLSPALQKLEMEIIDQNTCKKELEEYEVDVDESHICTKLDKGYGTCTGDSGGPLVQDDVVVGIVSGGIPCAKGYPDVFTNVYKYLNYIDEVINKSNNK